MPSPKQPRAVRTVSALDRLRRRREVEWLALYLGAGWIIYEAVGLTVDTFDLSVNVVRVTALLLALGALIAIPLAHWYQLTARALEKAGDGEVGDVQGVPNVLEPAFTRSYRRVNKKTIVLAGAGSTVLFSGFFFVLWTTWAAGHEKPVTDPRISMAVFPFRGAGVDGAAYGEGLADLVSAALDGTPGVRVSDPSAIWSDLRPERGAAALAPEPDEAARLSRKAAAQRYVIGSVTAAGANLDVTARVYDAQSGDVLATVTASAPQDSLRQAAQRVAIDILASVWDREQLPTVAEIDRFATSNADALKAYLEAVSLKRRGYFEEALPVIERAVALDSTFALAHLEHFYIRSLVLNLNNEPFEGVRQIIQKAMAHRERLSPRNRMRIEANQALDNTDGVQAAFLLERILSIDPLDVDARGTLAFTYMRDGWMLKKTTAEIVDAYDKALELDSTSVLNTATRARLALLSHDPTELQRAMERVRVVDTTSVYAIGTLGAFNVLMAPEPKVDSILELLADQPMPVVVTVLRELRAARPALAERYQVKLMAPTRSVTHQSTAAGSRVQLYLAEGRMAGVDSLLGTGEYENLRPVLNRLLIAAALAGVGDTSLAARAAAELSAFVPIDSIQPLIATSSYQIWAIAWAVGAYHATFGDSTEARGWQQAIADIPTGRTWFDWTGSLAADIGARIAARRGDLEAAEQEARRAYNLWTIHSNNPGAAFPETAMRFHLAEILDATGSQQRARWLYRSLVLPHGWQGFYTARSSFELGRIEEARGEREVALNHYLTAMRLWEHGDPEVVNQWLARTEEGIVRLRGEPSGA